MTKNTSLRHVAGLGLGLALLLAACAGAGSPSPGAEGSAPVPSESPGGESPGGEVGGAGAVQVTLQEWAVVPASATVPAGEVTFQVTNGGPERVHEFVVLRTDLAPEALPTNANGAADETAAGITVITEIEDIPVGETLQAAATLDPGTYVPLCNIFDETENEAHYQMGMRTAFTVTG